MNKKLLAFFSLPCGIFAAQSNTCTPASPATCLPDECKTCSCLGPATKIANAPARPVTCNGDWTVTIAGFYWSAHQDGMEYAINTNVAPPSELVFFPGATAELTNLIDANYQAPHFDWNWGFHLGLGYNTTCDGWDVAVIWTHYRGKARDHIEAQRLPPVLDPAPQAGSHTLLPLWTAFTPSIGNTVFADDIRTHWKCKMNLIDLELGREYWTSKLMTLRPFIGLRIAYLDQQWDLEHRGGSFERNIASFYPQDAVNNFVDIDQSFHGVGLRSGLDSIFHLGCGFGFYGKLAASILYGKFAIDHEEVNRLVSSPFTKEKVLDINEHFRASRAILDLGLGLQWAALFCDCKYGLTLALGWEQHLFFHQNQMWRVSRINPKTALDPFDASGENVYSQRSGTLATQGLTLNVLFAF